MSCEKRKNNEEGAAVVTQKKKKSKEHAIYGNYKHYYGYRIGHDMKEDPRLEAMKKEWFEGKDCLDIGCNSGVITIAIAQKFSCRSILGIDIDGGIIEDAKWTLRDTVRRNPTSNHLFDVVSFHKGNFVRWHPQENTSYDTIICLSVSKWVQLNWGDEGLLTLFSKVWRLLSPGGVFILEPQPWKSYYNNRLVSETTKHNYHNIEIRPEDFRDILLDKIGFRMVEDITSSVDGSKAGFKRPFFAFWK